MPSDTLFLVGAAHRSVHEFALMRIPIYQVDAFAEKPFEGNPAAVCPLEAWLDDGLLQSIASENNLSETAFSTDDDGGYEIRWFTPVGEVDLSGHATLATAFIVFEPLLPEATQVVFHSRSGPLPVHCERDRLTLDFPAQPGETCTTPELLEKALGAAPLECFRGADYMAVYESQSQIESMTPDFRLLKELDCRGVIVTAPGEQTDFVSRFFAPRHGIDEDPVTGSAHCALTPFWAAKMGKTRLSAKQLSQRTGRLNCQLAGDRVRISGTAHLYLTGEIYV